jgi:hypothetical protein
MAMGAVQDCFSANLLGDFMNPEERLGASSPPLIDAIGLYLLGFRDIGRSLRAGPGTMQTSLTVFAGGAAFGQSSEED